jgi:hypothetical protein
MMKNDDKDHDEEEDNLFLLCASRGVCGGFIFARAVCIGWYFYVSWEQLLETK